MSCRAASAATPFESASLARGRSADLYPSVSPGSWPFSRKRDPSVTRNSFASCRAFLITDFSFMADAAFRGVAWFGSARAAGFDGAASQELARVAVDLLEERARRARGARELRERGAQLDDERRVGVHGRVEAGERAGEV